MAGKCRGRNLRGVRRNAVDFTGEPPAGTMMSQLPVAATTFSAYARRMLECHPEWSALLQDDTPLPDRPAMLAWLESQSIDGEAPLRRALRHLRQRVLLTLLAQDMSGRASMPDVVRTVTTLAEISIEYAVAFAHQQLVASHGQPLGEDSGQPQQLLVVGMGKLGGGELNVSSDIDLVFVYEEDGRTDGTRSLSNHEFFTLLGRRLIQLLSEADENGFVFRVDMRLRPYGDSGPLVCSMAMLEGYLVAQGRMWERFAWMKARAITGDDQVLQQVARPFVYRKYLDYGAYAGIRDLHSQIRREVSRRDRRDNIKLGPGGIREIEFITQIFQLIRGGRETRLQVRGTLEALPLLAEAGHLPADAVQELWQAYDFLRKLEHRLQYRDDQQTQTLPAGEADLRAVAHSMGFADTEPFLFALNQHRQSVSRHFEDVFSTPEDQSSHPLMGLWQGSSDDETATLASLGFADPAAIAALLGELRRSPRLRQLPAGNRQRLDQLMPPLLEAASRQEHPDDTLRRLMHLMEAISRRESYLALLTENPQTLQRVADLYSASPWVSDFLTRHPLLLDELLDTRTLYKEPDWPSLADHLHQQMQAAVGDIETQMNILREFQHAQTLRLVACDLSGLLTLERLSDHLAALADLILQETIPWCWQDVRSRHRDDPQFAIVGYGKLGAKEIGYASDLDLIFLYEDDHENASENYARLAKKLSTWLSTLTRSGILYEVDLRLRPNGASGLLVSSTAAFEHYQLHEAWVWEHQALTRARYCAGHPAIGQRFEQIRAQVLAQPRDGDKLRTEVLAMRAKMDANHKPVVGQFDIKNDRGGLIDLEFAVQYLILLHAGQHPSLLANAGNIALLARAAAAGLIAADTALAAANAYRQLRREQHRLRLAGADKSILPASQLQAERDAVAQLWQQVLGDVRLPAP